MENSGVIFGIILDIIISFDTNYFAIKHMYLQYYITILEE